MLYFKDDKAREIVVETVKKYEEYFGIDFPLFEYIESENVTVDIANKLSNLIENCIIKDKPVETPEDYKDRLY